MYEHVKSLKEGNLYLLTSLFTYLLIYLFTLGKSIKKPIYNHVNGTLDTPETVEPTRIVIIEGLHPLVDSRVRSLIDFSIYLGTK